MIPTQEIQAAALAIRSRVLNMAASPQGAHVGGSLSCADILAVLYFDVLRLDAPGFDITNCDAFVLSKGHAAPALYATLAECGFLEPSELEEYASPGSHLFAHPTRGLPGVEFSTGSLGHGLGLGLGLALAAQLDGQYGRTYVLLGDGELQEGSVWESLMYGGHGRMSNLVAVIDRNGLQITGGTEDCVKLEPLDERLSSFGWEVRNVDGHDIEALRSTLSTPPKEAQPVAVVARTIKGRGVGFLEGKVSSHYAKFDSHLLRRALGSLQARAREEF